MEQNAIILSAPIDRGLSYECPSCSGLIWINTDWPGLPKWIVKEDGSTAPWKCPWCYGIATLSMDGKLTLMQQGQLIDRLSASDILIIPESSISEVLFKLLINRARDIGDGSFGIGGNFSNEDDLRQWCGATLAPLTNSNKLIRLPVLDV